MREALLYDMRPWQMCGNGIRCMARFVAELENTTEQRRYTCYVKTAGTPPKFSLFPQMTYGFGIVTK